MGRPIKKLWLNNEDAEHATLFDQPAGNITISGLCKIGANPVADYTILEQKGTTRFKVQDSAGNEGLCTLVNKIENTEALTTTLPLDENEMIMNCKNHNNVIHRVMKIMNRTLVYQADGSTTNVKAMWNFTGAAAGSYGVFETVELETAEDAGGFVSDTSGGGGASYVEYNNITQFGDDSINSPNNNMMLTYLAAGYFDPEATEVMLIEGGTWAAYQVSNTGGVMEAYANLIYPGGNGTLPMGEKLTLELQDTAGSGVNIDLDCEFRMIMPYSGFAPPMLVLTLGTASPNSAAAVTNGAAWAASSNPAWEWKLYTAPKW